MMKKSKVGSLVLMGVGFLALFVLLIILLCFVDVASVGEHDLPVGLSSINRLYASMIGQHDYLTTLTDVTGVLLLLFPLSFAGLGLWELIRGKSFCAVGGDLYCLAGFYAMMAVCYLFFEVVVINYRPIFEGGVFPEASFPSSHTLLGVCVGASSIRILTLRLAEKHYWRRALCTGITFVTLVTIVGRALSGVHWLTDILGGILLASALLCFLEAALYFWKNKQSQTEETV